MKHARPRRSFRFTRAAAVLLVLAAASGAAAQTSALVDEEGRRQAAGEHYRRGQELFGEGNAEDALRELQVSYALVPHWATSNGIALCFEDLERPQDALNMYVRGLREGGADIPAEQRAQMEERVVALRTELGLGHVAVLSTPPGATVTLSGSAVGTTPLDTDVPAGSYALTVELPGVGSAQRPLVVRAGETRVLELALVPLDAVPATPVATLRVDSEPSGAVVLVDGQRVGVTPLLTSQVALGEHALRIANESGGSWDERVTLTEGTELRIRVEMPVAGIAQGWFWGAAATAAALGITGAATGGYGATLYSEYEDSATSRERRIEVRDLGQTMFDVADGMFIAAGVAAIGALVLGLFTDFGGGPGEAEAEIDVQPLGGGATDATAFRPPDVSGM
jgi:hypothetical protein